MSMVFDSTGRYTKGKVDGVGWDVDRWRRSRLTYQADKEVVSKMEAKLMAKYCREKI